jgi:cold-inducible RNA-binding protein
MSNKLYVGNLSYDVTSDQLRGMFGPYGSVQSAKVASDRETNRSKGFGFVEMASEQEARAAITGMHGTIADGRTLTVSEANPKVNLTAQPSRNTRGAPGDARY